MEGVDALRKTYSPAAGIQSEALVKTMEQYKEMYGNSISDPEGFWRPIAEQFYFKSQPQGKFLDFNFDVNKGPIEIKWMQGAVTNICYNALDKHIQDGHGDKIAFYWEGNDPADEGKITYSELLKNVCKLANVLKANGVKRGDRVAIYMPMIVELSVALLACARIGAIHSIVFAGFSAESLAERMQDGAASILLTADGAWRGTKLVDLKSISDRAIELCAEKGLQVNTCLVVRHLSPEDEVVYTNGTSNGGAKPQTGSNLNSEPGKRPYQLLKVNWVTGRDQWWHTAMSSVSDTCDCEWMDVEDPLFMLYTSGSTGKPKGVLHTTGGYMLYAATTFKYTFDYHDDDVYWCTADVGWITGHTYVCYGPLLNGATSVIFEGTPFYPDAGRLWQVVEKYKVSKFYTAPTAIRSLMKFGESVVKKYDLSSLKVLGTVGEPINPEAWVWYYNIVGRGNCSIVDTFWQTETGGHTITSLPGCTPMKPGSATFPFFGIKPEIVDENCKPVETGQEGYLVFSQPWPGIMRTVYGDHQRYETTYFKKFPGYYCTGDGAKMDEDGYIWVTGRIDDMVNVSGHLLSTAEIESALIEHSSVVEAAVVSHPHEIKGESTYCFVTLSQGLEFTDALIAELKNAVRTKIGPFASPDVLQNAPGLPKTRSGKIMRRVLRKIARNDRDVGDISTMADDTVVEMLFSLRPDTA